MEFVIISHRNNWWLGQFSTYCPRKKQALAPGRAERGSRVVSTTAADFKVAERLTVWRRKTVPDSGENGRFSLHRKEKVRTAKLGETMRLPQPVASSKPLSRPELRAAAWKELLLPPAPGDSLGVALSLWRAEAEWGRVAPGAGPARRGLALTWGLRESVQEAPATSRDSAVPPATFL